MSLHGLASDLIWRRRDFVGMLQEWKIVDKRKLAGRLRHVLRGLEEARTPACSK